MKNTLRDIEELPDLGITLADGTRLSARVWRPVDAHEDPVPAILEYLPYRKRDGTCARDALTHPYFAKRGYAAIRVDIRGNGDSDGLMEDEYSAQELADAVELIHWLAAQPWCTGNIGMMGISWGGFNGLQVAALAPEPLKAVITLCSTVDRFADDIHYKGGCLLNENLGWGATMWSYSSRAPDPALRADWRRMWLNRLEHEPFLPELWLRHQRRDAYWAHGSVCEDFSAIKARVLAIGGWGDAYKNAVPQIVSHIPGSKGIVGPWVHKYPHFAVPEPRIGFLQEALRWWDQWLKGIETGVKSDADYSVYVMNGVRPATWYEARPGNWINQSSARSRSVRMHFGNAGLEEAGFGHKECFERCIASPQDTGADAGEYCAIWLGPELPGDQRADDAKSVFFDSAPLEEDLCVAGAPHVTLRLTSDQPQGQLAVRLNHVHPDGAVTRITYGVLNLTHRNRASDPRPMPVDDAVDIKVSLDHIAYRVPQGHRLRVSISNAYWPLVWPAPVKAQLVLTQGHVDLPVHENTGQDERVFPPPDTDAPWQTTQIRPENHVRRSETDHTTGDVHLIIEDDFGKVQDSEHGLIAGTVARELWTIHPDDPLSARGECHWTDELEREDVKLRTEARCRMWSDRTHFYLVATMEAFENDLLIFEKDVETTIPRDQM